jgi:hypothetical protein
VRAIREETFLIRMAPPSVNVGVTTPSPLTHIQKIAAIA